MLYTFFRKLTERLRYSSKTNSSIEGWVGGGVVWDWTQPRRRGIRITRTGQLHHATDYSTCPHGPEQKGSQEEQNTPDSQSAHVLRKIYTAGQSMERNY